MAESIQANGFMSELLQRQQPFRTLENIETKLVRQEEPKTPHSIYTWVNSLLEELTQLIKQDIGLYQEKSDADIKLAKFLANETNQYLLDDCVGCLMLSEKVEDRAAWTVLRRNLIKVRPLITFLSEVDENCDFTAWNASCSETTPYFKWKCSNVAHQAIMSKFWRVSGSLLIQAINDGSADTVKLIIDSSTTYFENSGLDPTVAKMRVSQMLGWKCSPYGDTALEFALSKHNTTFESPAVYPDRDLELSHRLQIVECLLKFDSTLGVGEWNFQRAMNKGNADAIETILDHGPKTFLPEETVVKELGKHREDIAALLVESWCRGNSLSKSIVEEMIVVDLPSLWKLESVEHSLKALLQASPADARELLHLALESAKPEPFSWILQTSPEAFDLDAAKKVVELDKWEFWELEEVQAAWQSLRLTDPPPDLISVAVRYQRERFVRQLVADIPLSVLQRFAGPAGTRDEVDETNRVYPLWHNNFEIASGSIQSRKDLDGKATETRGNIRRILVSACIRLAENMQDLCEIFHHSGESITHISLDLSQFNSKFYPPAQFINALIQVRGKSKVASYRFESTLRYVDFPALDLNGEDQRGNGYQEHTEVFDLLRWLRNEQKVEEIIKLKVPDRMCNPHDESTIALTAERFRIRVLDWRCLDLSFSVFKKLEIKSLQNLHLYASGKRAVVSHWLSDQGILSYPQIKHLTIHLVKELMSEKQAGFLLTVLDKGLKKLKNRLKKKSIDFQYEVDVESWDMQPIRSNATLSQISERAVPKLWPFIEVYDNYIERQKVEKGQPESKPWKPTRVAIIDNGIMSIAPFNKGPENQATTGVTSVLDMNPASEAQGHRATGAAHDEEDSESDAEEQEEPDDGTDGVASGNVTDVSNNEKKVEDPPHDLNSRVVDGQSFLAEENRLGSWSFASDPHGTQMANLICAIDPHCEILIAKVTEGRFGIDPERLSRAIRWAVRQGADVISMSLATYELDKDDRLQKEVVDAAGAGVLLVCAAHDEGLNVGEAYPASMPETVTLAASNQFGRATDQTPKLYDYRIHATNITVGAVPFMKSDECISGSSVATAIAAGLSSLIIACRRLTTGEIEESVKTWKRKIVENKFKQTKPENDLASKYVQLDKFCSIDERTKNSAPLHMEEILDQEFSKASLGYS